MTPIVVVRHAPPTTRGICYGRADVPTAPPADAAAALVAGRLAGPPRRLWTSPAPRCRDLAGALAERLGGLSVRADARLQELSFGDWEGRSWDALQAEGSPAYGHWMAHYLTAAPPGGESVPELTARVGQWLPQHRAGDLLVAHAGVVRAFLVLVGGVDWTAALATPVPHLEPRVITPGRPDLSPRERLSSPA